MQLFMDGLILAVLSAAVWLDFDAWRIPNGLIIFGTAAGAGLNFYLTRLFGLADAFAGFLIPFICDRYIHLRKNDQSGRKKP